MAVRNYQELIVWQKAMDLVEEIYYLSGKFPNEELYALTSQVRRAAVSIPSNIAEGQSRSSTAEFSNFLSIAQGSRAEVETQVLIARRLGYVDSGETKKILELAEEIKRMIYSMRKKFK